MLVAMVLALGLVVASLLATAYHAHALFLRTRSLVVRETAGAITADFNRALATMLALATRSYYDDARFADLTSRFRAYGLVPRNLTSARRVARLYLGSWATAQKMVYAEHGAQVDWSTGVVCVSHLVGRHACFSDLIFIDWNGTAASSYIYAQLRLNLTHLGLYNWVVESLVGLTLLVDEYYTSENAVRIRVLSDNGTYYGLLLARGWVEVYHLKGGSWVKVSIKDVTYEGLGYYRLTLEGRVGGTTLLIVVSDERGVLALAQFSVAGEGKGRGERG